MCEIISYYIGDHTVDRFLERCVAAENIKVCNYGHARRLINKRLQQSVVLKNLDLAYSLVGLPIRDKNRWSLHLIHEASSTVFVIDKRVHPPKTITCFKVPKQPSNTKL